METSRQEWQKLTKEAPLEPSLPICDPHHHLWDYPDNLPEDRVSPSARHQRHYLLSDLLKDLGGHNILQTVFIECRTMYNQNAPPALRPAGEVEFVQGIAAQSLSGLYGKTEVAAGIVGFADLTLGSAVAPVLEAEISAGKNRFRGIRYITTWDASSDIASRVDRPKVLSESKFREGFAYLKKYNLSFDAWLYHTQIPDLVSLAKAFPDTTIILNHIGGPIGIGPYAGKRKEVFEAWKKSIAALAACPNAVIKLGGLGMPLGGFGWHAAPKPPGSAEVAKAMAPYYNWCIEKFGVNRCMFESNFPVDGVSYSYTVIWNAFKRMTKDFTPAERSALFHDTAVRVYRLAKS